LPVDLTQNEIVPAVWLKSACGGIAICCVAVALNRMAPARGCARRDLAVRRLTLRRCSAGGAGWQCPGLRQASTDGEIIVQDESGVSSFAQLQEALSQRAGHRLLFYTFDLVYLDGYDLTKSPLIERKARLRALLPKDPLLIYSEHLPEHGKRL